ncbi:MAG: hypothetical protein ACT4P2_02940 [Pseudomonadota bacterium]
MSDKDKTAVTQPTRRNFFKKAALGAGAAIVGAATLGTGVVAPPAKAEGVPKGQGYRETEHVKRYYELANKY